MSLIYGYLLNVFFQYKTKTRTIIGKIKAIISNFLLFTFNSNFPIRVVIIVRTIKANNGIEIKAVYFMITKSPVRQ